MKRVQLVLRRFLHSEPPNSANNPLHPPKPKPTGDKDQSASSAWKGFNERILRDAQQVEALRSGSKQGPGGAIFRYDASLTAKIRTLEEQQRQVDGLRGKMGKRIQKAVGSILDAERNEQERKEILDALFKKGSGFDDHKEIARKGAKLWTAKETSTPAKSAIRMPNFAGTSLTGSDTDLATLLAGNTVSLVTFAFAAFGDPHVASFADPFEKEFLPHAASRNTTLRTNTPGDGLVYQDPVSLIQFNIEEEWTKQWVLKLFRPYIRAFRVPKHRHERYLTYLGDVAQYRELVGMTNHLLGWVHLVDGEGRVRWTAHGMATNKELNSMVEITKALLSGHK